MLNTGLPLGRKLFEEVDKPTGTKIVSEDKKKGLVERQSTWTGDITGYNSFPSGRASGSGSSYIHSNSGTTISHWEGVFYTEDKEQLTFKGREQREQK